MDGFLLWSYTKQSLVNVVLALTCEVKAAEWCFEIANKKFNRILAVKINIVKEINIPGGTSSKKEKLSLFDDQNIRQSKWI